MYQHIDAAIIIERRYQGKQQRKLRHTSMTVSQALLGPVCPVMTDAHGLMKCHGDDSSENKK